MVSKTKVHNIQFGTIASKTIIKEQICQTLMINNGRGKLKAPCDNIREIV